MEGKIKIIEKLRSTLLRGGGFEAIEARHKSGKLTARERIARLLDPGTFYEVELFLKPIVTGFPVDRETVRGDGLISGYGEVNGRPVCVWAQDATILDGRSGIIHGSKIVTLVMRAIKAGVPCIGIIDSAGVRVEDVITTPTNYSYDRLMYVQTMASGVIPQISLIMGPCTGAAAISAQISDFVFMVRDSSYSCVSKPPEGIGWDEMGGAAIHFKKSGCCDLLANGDEDCLERARELLGFLPLNQNVKPPEMDTGDDPEREVPELVDIVPVDSRKPYRIQDVIHVIADNGRFLELKGGWAMNLAVGFARFGGRPVGVIANNPWVLGGCLDVDSSDKLTRFVRFCDAFNIPILYLADTPAFLPAIEQERKGIIRHGAKTIFANSVATTPQMQVYLRKCYGGGNLAMPGSNLEGDVGLAWPTAELLLMHPEGAVAIIYRKEIADSENPGEEFDRRLAEFRKASAVENIWEYLFVQDYIHPQKTRSKIIRTLKILGSKKVRAYSKRHDNMPL